MSYIEENLLPGEKLLHKALIHWIIYVPGIVFVLLGFVFYVATRNVVAGVVILVGLGVLAKCHINRMNTEFAVTNKRIMAKIGWLARAGMDISHSKIESIIMDQTAWGRIFNYGTLTIHGTGSGIEAIGNIEDPLAFRKIALEAMEESKVNK